MRLGRGLSWVGAACAACGVFVAGVEPSAEAARKHGTSIDVSPSVSASASLRPEKVLAREPGALVTLSTTPASAAAPPPAPNPATDTPMCEEDATLHLAEAWRAVTGKSPSERTLSLLWAHWAHETGRGRRMYGFNFGGLKGRGPDGTGLLTWTREMTGSASGIVQRTFRVYPSAEAGALDYVELLAARFPSALRAARVGNVQRFVGALSSRGYFTDDQRAYERAIASLDLECRRRGLPELALRQVRQ